MDVLTAFVMLKEKGFIVIKTYVVKLSTDASRS
jgi:hypothetical protein